MAPKATRILLGIDVHRTQYTVVRKIEEQLPQPAQRFSPPQFLLWVKKQLGLAHAVHACYEAGPLGYGLYRQLQALGVHALVIVPQNLDERGKRVKTDKIDGRALVLRLDRYLAGNHEALGIVRVPSPEQEQRRSESRMRQRLQKERQRLIAMGRGLLLFHGFEGGSRWWQAGPWAAAPTQWPAWLVKLLQPIRELILVVHRQQRDWTKHLTQATVAQPLPVGLGDLSHALAEREVCDWQRFENRRQVSSFTGLCPGEDSSGRRRWQGAITKHGNPRLRHLLIELAWRMVRYQPNYRAVRRWWPVLGAPKASPRQRKKAIVALARELAVDLWRLATGRVEAAALGLQLRASAAPNGS